MDLPWSEAVIFVGMWRNWGIVPVVLGGWKWWACCIGCLINLPGFFRPVLV
jgi:hypothetical protein